MLKILIFLLSANTFAQDYIFEKTYPRDNTFCQINGKTVEFMIRGESKFSEPKEKGYGEHAFYRQSGKKIAKVLKIGHEKSGSYKFFTGIGSSCSKSLAFKVDDRNYAVLFLKDNRPYPGRMVIQFFDQSTLTPGEILFSNYLSTKAEKYKDGFSFNSLSERLDIEIGKVTLDDKIFNYQDREFPIWMTYVQGIFSQEPELTYKKFQYKKAFKDQNDFLQSAGWDEKEKKFKNTLLYFAVNHQLRKSCVAFLSEKKPITGGEAWKCFTL